MIVPAGSEYVDAVSSVMLNSIGSTTPTAYDFVTAGYSSAANTPLNDTSKGSFLLSIDDPTGNPATIRVEGVDTLAVNVPYLLVGSDHFASYLRWNYPTIPGTYKCTAVFSKAGGQNEVVFTWTTVVQ